ncbi:hypothetical protein BV25DRAFT_1839774 [Artomyces pyxidatus]|uniref:Uncharacterized protein n=1 Tax=Artomyces pyxidatus TaxID=48021 RepID=A0ACB8SVH5_9AGAM|nr:hypothetical protein BV25DRAFT_1839774 [Artomyces pyxidatus]
MASTCSDYDKDGRACPCRRHKQYPDYQPGQPDYCVNCGHYDTCHPLSEETVVERKPPARTSVSDMVSKLKNDLLRSSGLGSLEAAAREETNAGLRGQDGRLSGKAKGKGKSRGTAAQVKSKANADEKKSFVGTVVMIPWGLQVELKERKHTSKPIKQYEMNRTTSPHRGEIEEFTRHGLAVCKGPDNEDISFTTNMDASDIDTYLRQLFPDVFQYLDETFPLAAGKVHWVILVKGQRTLVIVDKPNPTARDVLQARWPASKKWDEQTSKHEIPEEVYEGWGDEQASMTEVEDNQDVEERSDDGFHSFDDSSDSSIKFVSQPRTLKTKGKGYQKSVPEKAGLSKKRAITLETDTEDEVQASARDKVQAPKRRKVTITTSLASLNLSNEIEQREASIVPGELGDISEQAMHPPSPEFELSLPLLLASTSSTAPTHLHDMTSGPVASTSHISTPNWQTSPFVAEPGHAATQSSVPRRNIRKPKNFLSLTQPKRNPWA